MCMAQLQAVGQAKTHGLKPALAWPEILESQSHWLRLWLCYVIIGNVPTRPTLSNNKSQMGMLPINQYLHSQSTLPP